MEQNKWKSPVVWVTLATAVIGFLVNTLELNIDSELVLAMVNACVTLLVGFGILNNPTNKSGF